MLCEAEAHCLIRRESQIVSCSFEFVSHCSLSSYVSRCGEAHVVFKVTPRANKSMFRSTRHAPCSFLFRKKLMLMLIKGTCLHYPIKDNVQTRVHSSLALSWLTGGGNSSLSGSPLKKPPRGPPRGPRPGLGPMPRPGKLPKGPIGSKRAPGGTAPLSKEEKYMHKPKTNIQSTQSFPHLGNGCGPPKIPLVSLSSRRPVNIGCSGPTNIPSPLLDTQHC